MKEKIVILGSTGPISAGLAARYTDQSVVIGRGPTADHYFDLADSNTFGVLEQLEVRHAVFLSGITGFKRCEENNSNAFRINVKQTSEVVAILTKKGVPVTYLSSSAVFGKTDLDRSEWALPTPDSVYGKTKRLAEREIMSASRVSNSVVRLTKVFDKDLPILRQWRESALAGNKLAARRDYLVAPLPLTVVIDYIQKIVEQKTAGITHLTPDRGISYYHLAHALFPEAQLEEQGGDPSLDQSMGAPYLMVKRPESELINLNLCVEYLKTEINNAKNLV